MNCRQCGNKIPDKYLTLDRFKCPTCGKAYVRTAASNAQRTQSNQPEPVAQVVKHHMRNQALHNNKKFIFAGGVLLLVLIIVVIILCSTQRDDRIAQQSSATSVPTKQTTTQSPIAAPTSTLAPAPTAAPTSTVAASTLTTNTSVSDFIKRFEAGMQYLDFPCTVIDKGLDEYGLGTLVIDDLLTFNYQLANGAITELVLVGVGDGTTESGLRLVYATISAMYGIDETTNATSAVDIVARVLEGETYVGTNYKMSSVTSDLLGLAVFFTGTSSQDSLQPTATSISTKAPSASVGERNALSKAMDYLNVMPFSKEGLIDQLEYEGYSHSEATYAVENCGADWNEQAALKAKDYLEIMSFSRSSLIDQLVHDGFTEKQAEYGAEKNGY